MSPVVALDTVYNNACKLYYTYIMITCALASRLANFIVGTWVIFGNGAIFGSMIAYKNLVRVGQKSQALLT